MSRHNNNNSNNNNYANYNSSFRHPSQDSSSRDEMDNNNNNNIANNSNNESGSSFRSRSATVPCRAYCEQSIPINYPNIEDLQQASSRKCSDLEREQDQHLKCTNINANPNANNLYKVSEIIRDQKDELMANKQTKVDNNNNINKEDDNFKGQQGESLNFELASNSHVATCSEDRASLWLGCDDGSLIIIDCLSSNNNKSSNNAADEGGGATAIPTTSTTATNSCQNVHSEINLGAPICDIKNYKDEMVFVALASGQLVVIKRATYSTIPEATTQTSADERLVGEWQLSSPQIISLSSTTTTTTTGESNQQMNKACLIITKGDEYLWFSFGRHIFVLNIGSLTLERTIMTPTSDKSIQFAMQTVSIDSMELVDQLNGVWVSFRNSPLIQFYSCSEFKLQLEMSLLEPINKILSCGNEIIRQHKTACLGTTSLLSIYNELEESNSLFIGTTAGLILILTITSEQLREQISSERLIWNPQVISLRHGHSGQVRFMQLIELCKFQHQQQQRQSEQVASRQSVAQVPTCGSNMSRQDGQKQQRIANKNSNKESDDNGESEQVAASHELSAGQEMFEWCREINKAPQDEKKEAEEEGEEEAEETMKRATEAEQVVAESRNLCLVSGGAGVDLYGPNDAQQIMQHLNRDSDCLSHLILWEL